MIHVDPRSIVDLPGQRPATFEELCGMKVGDTFYETAYVACWEFTVRSTPLKGKDDYGQFLMWAASVGNSGITNFFVRDNAIYQPTLYLDIPALVYLKQGRIVGETPDVSIFVQED